MCRLIHFYGMTHAEAMNLRMRTFWFMNSCINRIQAERDMRNLTLTVSANSKEAIREFKQSLEIELGDVMKTSRRMNDERDEVGIQKLRAMTGKRG